MGNLGDKTQGQVLFADQGWIEATQCRSCELGKGHGPGGPVSGGGVVKLRFAVARLLALFRKRNLDRELEDEVLAHLELAERDAISRGLTPEEARQAARRSFGGIEQMKEDHRDHRSVRWMENLLRDFRHGAASLARDPGFAAVTIGLLALGIGANTAMFSIVDAVL